MGLEPGVFSVALQRISRVFSQPSKLNPHATDEHTLPEDNTVTLLYPITQQCHPAREPQHPTYSRAAPRGKWLTRDIWLVRRYYYKPVAGAAPRAAVCSTKTQVSVPALTQPLKPMAKLSSSLCRTQGSGYSCLSTSLSVPEILMSA